MAVPGGRMFYADLPIFRHQAMDQWGAMQLGKQREQGANLRAQLAADTQRASDHFNDVFPTFKGYLSSALAGGPGGGGGPGPDITVSPVWTQGQMDQQVNAARATSNAQTQTAMRGMQQQLGARGYGSNSPLMAALQSQMEMGGMQRGADLERNIRWDSAQGNADQLLKSQVARENQFASRQQEANQRLASYNQMRTGLLGALAGLAR